MKFKMIVTSVSMLLISFLTLAASAQVKVVKFPELNKYITSNSATPVRVINFWATWCGPCVKELPYFDSLQFSYDPGKLEVMLVSLDFPDQLERVNKFLDRKKITSQVWLLNESDANSYIDRVEPKWSGAIPATLLINSSTGERIFLEKELTKEELNKYVSDIMN